MESNPSLNSTLRKVDERAVLVPDVRVTLTPPQGPEVRAALGMDPLVLGTSSACDIVVADRQVSRRHCELRLTPRGVVLRDLGSKNGTFIEQVPIIEAILELGRTATIGGSRFTAASGGDPALVAISTAGRFGDAIGESLAMRALFAKLERASATEETILLLGESGTGKEVLARAIHEASPRSREPFVVLDCGAVAPTLLDAELFGHARGAFTGAVSARDGLLAEAGAGTIFIDEIGEMPVELQPKLLRAIEARELRRLGTSEHRPFQARIVAATHRNLRARVAEGAFREDLYYRLAVVELSVPALRERKDDIPLLVSHFLSKQASGRGAAALPPSAMSLLMAHDWPGNVRELRNIVTRLLLFPDLFDDVIRDIAGRPPALAEGAPPEPPSPSGSVKALLKLSLREVRDVAIEQIEGRYLAEKLREHRFNISRVAEDIGASRQLVYRLLERYGLRGRGDEASRDE